MKKVVLLMAFIAVAVVAASGAVYAMPRDSGPSESAQAAAEAALADLKVSKVASDAHVSVGEDFTWTVRVANRGPSRAANVRLVDTLPISVRLLNILPSQGGPCQVDFPQVVCTLDTVGKGQAAVINFKAEATRPGTLRNVARASSTTPEVKILNNRSVSVVRAG